MKKSFNTWWWLRNLRAIYVNFLLFETLETLSSRKAYIDNPKAEEGGAMLRPHHGVLLIISISLRSDVDISYLPIEVQTHRNHLKGKREIEFFILCLHSFCLLKCLNAFLVLLHYLLQTSSSNTHLKKVDGVYEFQKRKSCVDIIYIYISLLSSWLDLSRKLKQR